MQQIGSTLGLSVLVTVYGSALHSADPAGIVHAMTAAFVVAAAIAAVTIPVALTFRRPAPTAPTPAAPTRPADLPARSRATT
jgi:predicted aconitase with swiveling domain